MGDFPQELEAVPLFLQRIRFGIGRAQDCERLAASSTRCPLPGLSLSSPAMRRLAPVVTCLMVSVVSGNVGADDDLQVGQATAVVQLDERKTLLRIAARAHPAGDFERLPRLPALEDFDDSGQSHRLNRVKPTADPQGGRPSPQSLRSARQITGSCRPL